MPGNVCQQQIKGYGSDDEGNRSRVMGKRVFLSSQWHLLCLESALIVILSILVDFVIPAVFWCENSGQLVV